MIKYFCDKCGKEIGEFEAYTILVEAPEIKSWADQYMYERRGYHVCRDCLAKIANFIEPKPTKKFEDEPQTERPTQCSECKVWHRCFKEKPSYNMIKSRCPIDESQTERSE